MRDTKLLHGFSNLSDAIGIPARTLKTLWKQRKISGIRAGHRTVLFNADKVLTDLDRLEVKAVC